METEVKQPVKQSTSVPSPKLGTRGWSTIALLLAFICGWGVTFAIERFSARQPAKASELVEKIKDVAAATKVKAVELSELAKAAPVKTTKTKTVEPPAVSAAEPTLAAPVADAETVAKKEADLDYLQEREMVKKLMEKNVETAKILSR